MEISLMVLPAEMCQYSAQTSLQAHFLTCIINVYLGFLLALPSSPPHLFGWIWGQDSGKGLFLMVTSGWPGSGSCSSCCSGPKPTSKCGQSIISAPKLPFLNPTYKHGQSIISAPKLSWLNPTSESGQSTISAPKLPLLNPTSESGQSIISDILLPLLNPQGTNLSTKDPADTGPCTTTGSNLLLRLRVQDQVLPLVPRAAETPQIQHKIYPKSDKDFPARDWTKRDLGAGEWRDPEIYTVRENRRNCGNESLIKSRF